MANFFEEPLVFPNIISGTSLNSYECRISMENFGNFHHIDSTISPISDEPSTISVQLNDDEFMKDDKDPLSPQEDLSSANFGNLISNQNLINTFSDIYRQNKDEIDQFNQKFYNFFQELRDSNSIQQFLSTNAITIQHNINIWNMNINNEEQTKEYNDFLFQLWFIPISELYTFLSVNNFFPCSVPKSCPICQNTFNTTFNLYQHINENHSNVNENNCPIIGSNILSLPTYIIELYLKYPKLIPSPFTLSEIIENHQVLECKCPFDCDRMSSSIHEYYLHLESHYQFNDGMNFNAALETCSEFWAKTQLLIKFNSKIPSLFDIMEFDIKSEKINGPMAIALNKQNGINDSFMKGFMNINKSIHDMKNVCQMYQNENRESIENLKSVIERCNNNINEINKYHHDHYNDQSTIINSNNTNNNNESQQQLFIEELKKETGMIKEVCSNLWNKCNDLTQEIEDINSQNSIKTKENQLYLSDKEAKIQELNQSLNIQSEELKLKDINHKKEINLIISNNNQERILMKEKIETMEFQIQQLENYNIMKKKTKEEEEIKTLQMKLKMDKDALNTMKTEILDLKKSIYIIQEENQKIKLVQESSNLEDDISKINNSIMKKYKELKNDIETMKSNFVIQNNKTLKMIKTNTNNILENHHMFKDLFKEYNAQIEISLGKYQQLQTSLTKQYNEEKKENDRNIYDKTKNT